MKRRSRILFIIGTVLWVAVIWGQSLAPAELSSQESGAAFSFLSSLLSAVSVALPLTEAIVRKMAHFAEYFVLGLLLTGAVSRGKLRQWFFRLAFLTLLIPFADETIQLFSDGRSGAIQDVWLDLAGCCTGIVLFLLLRAVILHKKARGR